NARALTGMLDVFGVFRPGSQNLVPYAVNAYTKQQRHDGDDTDFFRGLRIYAKTHDVHGTGHTPVHFVGLWDTVKSAGTLTRQLKWPFTRQLPHAQTIRHAVSIDESRRPLAPYLDTASTPSPSRMRAARSPPAWYTRPARNTRWCRRIRIWPKSGSPACIPMSG